MTKEINLPRGKKALVDDDDYAVLSRFKWQVPQGYAYRYDKRNKKYTFMHKLVLSVDGDIGVDHINGDKLDNRKENLRIATKSQNSHNRRKLNPEKFSSRYKGVCWSKKDRRWVVRIRINYKSIEGGSFKNEDDAARRYNELSIKHHGEFGRLNVIPEYVRERE